MALEPIGEFEVGVFFAMADVDSKYGDNAPGKFYVDEECIDCDFAAKLP